MQKKKIKKRIEKKEKKNTTIKQTNFLLVLSACFLVFLFLLGYLYTQKYSFIEYASPVDSYHISEIECLGKGKQCTREEILKGIKIRYAVSEEEKYDFYLISNTTTTATFLMAEDLFTTNWNDELINFKGPQEVLYELNQKTRSWSKVPVISEYEYFDYGHELHEKICVEGTEEYHGYDCDESGGYDRLHIEQGKGMLYYNLPPLEIENVDGVSISGKWDFAGESLRARLITLEEIGPLGTKDGFASWLVDHSKNKEAYWTLTSASYPGNGYVVEAHTIVNRKGHPSVESRLVTGNTKKTPIGVRPVITLYKS